MIFLLLENLFASSLGWGYGILAGYDTLLRHIAGAMILLNSSMAFFGDFSGLFR